MHQRSQDKKNTAVPNGSISPRVLLFLIAITIISGILYAFVNSGHDFVSLIEIIATVVTAVSLVLLLVINVIARGKGVSPKDTATQQQAQSAWDDFVAHQVLPAFQEIKSSDEQIDGTTIDMQQAPVGERWVRLIWMVTPSASVQALVPPSLRTAYPPQTKVVLSYTIVADEQSAQTTAWCETRIPDKAGNLTDSSRVFREALGDYRSGGLTKDMIKSNVVSNYLRHILDSGAWSSQ